MTEPIAPNAIAAALSERFDVVIAEWIQAYERSALRMPKPILRDELTARGTPLLDCLAELYRPRRDHVPGAAVQVSFRPGSPELREVEKAAAFLGANLGATDASGFDVAALVLSLRDVLAAYVPEPQAAELRLYFEWLSVLAVDSLCSAKILALGERTREQLENGTPVLQVLQGLPALMLVGEPDGTVLDSVFSRLLLLTVRVGAPSVIIDVSGAADQLAQPVFEALETYVTHRKVLGTTAVLAVGLGGDEQPKWRRFAETTGAEFEFFEHFDRAVDRGLSRLGLRVVKQTSTS